MTRLIRQMRVLIADRDEVSRNALAAMLTQRGFQVDLVGSGEAVFNAFANAMVPYDALVIDRDLPDLDGVHVARMLRANKGLQQVSVILVGSMVGLEQDRLHLEGIVDVIARPVKESRLLRGLMKQLRLRGETMKSLPAVPAPSLDRSARILMAEDNPDNQTYGRIVLEKAGHQVDIAANGGRAVELADRGVYDLILMDVQMPVMTGLEAAVAVRAQERKQGRLRVPIIALTGHAVEGFRERVLESGMDDYVTKPIRRQRLLDVVAEWMDVRPSVLALAAPDRRDWLVPLIETAVDVKVFPVSNHAELSALIKQNISPRLALIDAVSLDGQADTLRQLEGTIPRVLVLPPELDPDNWSKGDIPLVTGKDRPGLQSEIRKLITSAGVTRQTDDEPEPLSSDEGIRVHIDPDLMELIPGYLKSRKRDVQMVYVLLEEAGFKEIARIGHNMKGSGGGYGFQRITELGAILEQAAKDRDEQAVQAACAAIEDYVERVVVVPGD